MENFELPDADIDVAPHAGAWIETTLALNAAKPLKMSRPTRARGLKLDLLVDEFGASKVAPHAGAWIET